MPRVLVVDDSGTDRARAKGLLAKLDGVTVEEAVNGRQAVDRLDDPPDLILTDLNMPELDGLEVLEAVHDRCPHVPVILMTSKGSEDMAQVALKTGASSFLPKENLSTLLRPTVTNLLSLAGDRRQQDRLGRCHLRQHRILDLPSDPDIIGPAVKLARRMVEETAAAPVPPLREPHETQDLGFDETDRLRIGVALEEAITNAVYHGNLEMDSALRDDSESRYYAMARDRAGQDPFRSRRVRVELSVARTGDPEPGHGDPQPDPGHGVVGPNLKFVVSDEGSGFDPGELPDPTDPENLLKAPRPRPAADPHVHGRGLAQPVRQHADAGETRQAAGREEGLTARARPADGPFALPPFRPRRGRGMVAGHSRKIPLCPPRSLAALAAAAAFSIGPAIGSAAPGPGAFAADRAVLSEAADGVAAVSLRVTAEGTVIPTAGADPLEATVKAAYRFRTRRAPVGGVGPASRRAVRYYDAAGSELRVGSQPTYARLRGSRRLLVVTGTPRGVEPVCPAGPLRFGELELLGTPLDPLLVGGLLPAGSVAVGDAWEPPDWVAPALAGVEAVERRELTCELTALTDETAEGRFVGRVDGATDGAAVRTALSGTFTFDRAAGALTAVDLEQKVRSEPGPISPGAQLTFTAALRIDPTAGAGPLSAAVAADASAAAPIVESDSDDGPRAGEPVVSPTVAELVTPWGARAVLDRGWNFVNQTDAAAVLVRLDRGRPALTATLSPRDAAAPGAPPDADAFAAQVRQRLGDDGDARVERTANLTLPDAPDRRLVLVRVTGRDPAGAARVRDHYLVADAGGGRAEVAFTYPAELAELAEAHAFPLLDALTLPEPADGGDAGAAAQRSARTP